MKLQQTLLFLTFITTAVARPPAGVTPTDAPMTALNLGDEGDVFYFNVTGSDVGSAFGPGSYADNSRIAKAAVHAGALELSESGVIELTLTAGQSFYFSDTANGVSTSFGGARPQSFTIVLCPPADFIITAQPESVIADEGSAVTLSVATDSSGPSYQWFAGARGDETTPLVGETGATFLTTIPAVAASFWVKISDATGERNSATAILIPTISGTTNDWQDITISLPSAPSNENIGPMLATDTELYVLAEEGGVFRSTDDGQTFVAVNDIAGNSSIDLTIDKFRFVAEAGDYIYLGTDPGSLVLQGLTALMRLQPGDTEWVNAAQGDIPGGSQFDTVEDVTYEPSSGTYYAASAFDRAYTSTDGLNWFQSATGIVGGGQSLLLRNGKVFLSTVTASGFGIYESSDQGMNWVASGLPDGPGASGGELALLGNRILHSSSGTAGGVYYSDDNGASWKRSPDFLGNGEDIETNSSHAFSAGGFLTPLSFSATGGLTWDLLDLTGLPSEFTAIELEPSENFLFLTGTVGGETRLFRRTLSSLDLTPTTQFVTDPGEGSGTRYLNVDDSLTLEGLAAGPNISYQWQRDGMDVTGATSPTLTLDPISANDAGSYRLVVTGDDRSITSPTSVPVEVIPSVPGFQDVSFRVSSNPRRGAVVLYNDGRVVQIEAPFIQLLDDEGQIVVENNINGGPIIRRGFQDSNGDLMGWGEFTLERFDPDTLVKDASFSTVTFSSNSIRIRDAMELPGQGYLLALERDTELDGEVLPTLSLFDYTGDRVTTFINPFINSSPSFSPRAGQIALTPEGKILATVETAQWVNQDPVSGIVRLNSDGSRDNTFGAGGNGAGSGIALTVQPSGKILYATSSIDRLPQRLNADGSVDTSFNVAGTQFERNIAGFITQPNSKILVYGSFEAYGSDRAIGHARLNDDGTFDPSYDAQEGFKSGSTQRIVSDAVYDASRGLAYYIPGDGGGFRETEQVGLVRVFAGDAQLASPFLTYLGDFNVLADQQGEDDDPDGDGLGNLFEFFYGTNPSSSASRTILSEGSGTQTGAQINALHPSAGLDPSESYYTVSIRLAKNPPEAVTSEILATKNLPNFEDGSATLLPFGNPIDEGDALLQPYYQTEPISTSVRAFWILRVE